MSNINTFNNAPENVRLLVISLRDGLQDIFKDKLIGLYLYGSLAYGCFNPTLSDIDFVAVLKCSPCGNEEKILFRLHERLNNDPEFGKRLEGTYLTEEQAKVNVYPTPILYYVSYGILRKADNTSGDPDYPVHRQHLHDNGVNITGAAIKEVFLPVPWNILEQSLVRELPFAKSQFKINPVYAVLNICRVVRALELKTVSSKIEAGEWALGNLPDEFHEMIQTALNGYKHKPNTGENQFLTNSLDNFYLYCQKLTNISD